MFKEEYADLKISNTPEMIALSEACARRMGMEPYYLYRQKNMAGNFENVGYAVPGKECLYNILIMEEKQTIAACGAGTTTKVYFPAENRIERAENVKEAAWTKRVKTKNSQIQGVRCRKTLCNRET